MQEHRHASWPKRHSKGTLNCEKDCRATWETQHIGLEPTWRTAPPQTRAGQPPSQ